MSTLRELVDYQVALLDSDPEGDPALREQWFRESVAADLAVRGKVERVAAALRMFDDDIDAIAREKKRLEALLASKESARERLESYVLSVMAEGGITEISAPTVMLKSAQCPASVDLSEFDADNPDMARFIRRKVSEEPDKPAIKKALERGEHVPGAKLVKDKKRLVVR